VIAVDNGTPQLTGSRKGAIQTLELNQPPTVLPRGPYTVEVGSQLQFTMVAADSTDQNPLNVLFLSVVNPPANATFTDNGDNTGTFTFLPQTGQEGTDTVRFLAVDEGTPQLSTQLAVEITVLATNQAPILAPIGPQVLTEGDLITLNLSATDPDGTTPFFDHTKLPGNATFVDNGDGTAVFTWTPNYVSAGLHSVTFKALDGIATDKEVVLFQVADAGDQVPTFDTLVDPNILEGTTFTGLVYASDPDTLPVTIGVVEGTEPPTFTFTDSGNGIASYTMSPDYTMAGVYVTSLWVSDGTLADTTDLIITVDEAGNQPPVIAPRADTTTKELVQLQFTMTATDVDGDIPEMTAGNMPTGAAYTDLDNGSGFFNWTPSAFSAGTYDITFYARDTAGVANGGVLDIDSTIVQVTVVDSNRAPFIVEAVFNQQDTVEEGSTLVFVMHGIDPDSTIPTVTAVLEGADTLASNMIFTDSGDGYGYLEFTPDYTQGAAPLPRRYNISFQAVDEFDVTLASPLNTQLIRVYDVPQPPTITVVEGTDPVTINEGSAWQSIVTGSDVDGIIDSVRLVNPPPNAGLTFATGTTTTQLSYILTFAPDFTQAGTYTLTLEAFDPTGLTTLVNIDFTVVDAGNLAPTVINDPPTTKGAYLGLENEVVIQAEDRESDSIMFTVTGMAPNMTLNEDGAGAATILFTPDSSQIGATYDVTVDISDGADATSVAISYQVGVFMRGDADSNTAYTLNDAVVIANYLYRSGGLPDPWQRCDVDLSGIVDAADLAYLINYLYHAGPRPPQ